MPDLPHSTKHPHHSLTRPHILPQTIALGYTRGGGNSVQVCSPFSIYFRISRSARRQEQDPMKRAGIVAARATGLRVSLR
jgi:hypothetical protein